MMSRRKIQIFHNLLWSSYKGAVFSQLYAKSQATAYEISVVQIAETDSDRRALSKVDISYHRYPYTLLFRGDYFGISAFRRAFAAVVAQIREKADCVVINSYDDALCWAILCVAILRRQRIIVSLDSTYLDHPRVWYKEFVKRRFISMCDWAFCYGTRSREYLQRLGMDPSADIK
jgi:hypothetical protein